MKTYLRMSLAAALTLALGSAAQAAPITYTFSGDASGFSCTACNNTDNVAFSGAFTLTITSDTTSVDTSDPPFFRLHNVDGTFTDGGLSATLTGITIVVNSGTSGGPNVNFFNAASNDGLGMLDNAFLGYQLATSIGPVTDSGGNLTPTFNNGTFGTTGSNQVEFTANDSLTFQAVATNTAVPEPGTLTLIGLGIAGVARRRFKVRRG